MSNDISKLGLYTASLGFSSKSFQSVSCKKPLKRLWNYDDWRISTWRRRMSSVLLAEVTLHSDDVMLSMVLVQSVMADWSLASSANCNQTKQRYANIYNPPRPNQPA